VQVPYSAIDSLMTVNNSLTQPFQDTKDVPRPLSPKVPFLEGIEKVCVEMDFTTEEKVVIEDVTNEPPIDLNTIVVVDLGDSPTKETANDTIIDTIELEMTEDLQQMN